MSPNALQANDAVIIQQVPGFLEQTIANMVAFVPRLLGALVILLVGWVIGRVVARVVRRLADIAQIDRAAMRTPLGDVLGGSEAAVSRAFGIIAAWYVYFLAILAAANVLAIPMLSEWVDTAVSYLPSLIAGLLIIVLGFILADYVARTIRRTATSMRERTSGYLADSTRVFLYFIVLVVGLETMGVDVGILYIFAGALAFGLALALAIGAGLAIGLGGREYVDENIGQWMQEAQSTAGVGDREPPGGAPTGTDDD